MEEHLDLPACAVPLDELAGLLQCVRRPVRQQPPAHGLVARGGTDFAGHHTAHLDGTRHVMVHRHPLDPQFLAHPAGAASGSCAQGELDLPQRLAGLHLVPQTCAAGQAAVVLRAHQQVHRPAQALGALHQREDVALAVTDLHQPGFRQLARSLGQPLVAFDPTRALAQPAALTARIARLARPHPRVQHAQRLTLRADRVGGVQVHAALGLVAQRAQALNRLPIEVQLGRVVQAQHHRQPRHSPHCAAPVRFDDLTPVAALVVEHAVGRRRIAPASTGRRDARRGLGRQFLGQLDQSVVQPLVSRPRCPKLLPRPRHRSNPSSNHKLA